MARCVSLLAAMLWCVITSLLPSFKSEVTSKKECRPIRILYKTWRRRKKLYLSSDQVESSRCWLQDISTHCPAQRQGPSSSQAVGVPLVHPGLCLLLFLVRVRLVLAWHREWQSLGSPSWLRGWRLLASWDGVEGRCHTVRIDLLERPFRVSNWGSRAVGRRR